MAFARHVSCSVGNAHGCAIESDNAQEGLVMETLIQQIINGLVLGSMYELVALGYTMV